MLVKALGGDTDTNSAIAGQIAGTLIGREAFPEELIHKLKELKDYQWIITTIEKYLKRKNDF